MPIRNKHIRSGETTTADRVNWRRRAAAVAFAASLGIGISSCSKSYSEAETPRDVLPATSQGDTYIRPDPQESIPLNLDGIFTEGTVGEEALSVVASDSGICFDGGTTREISPMYYVDEGAAESLVVAIEQATSELKTAREAGNLLGGVAPNGAEVYVQLGYLERPQYTLSGNELISENRPDTVYIDVLDTATGAVYKLLLFHEETSEGCEQGDWWVGTAYGPPSADSQLKRFGEVLGAANDATGFEIVKQGAINSSGPIIRFAYEHLRPILAR